MLIVSRSKLEAPPRVGQSASSSETLRTAIGNGCAAENLASANAGGEFKWAYELVAWQAVRLAWPARYLAPKAVQCATCP
jgi:hypothetical protein